MTKIVSNLRIPTYINGVELGAFIMEKRGGERIEYTTSSSPSINEINDRLLATESSLAKLMNNQWRIDSNTYETMWTRYGGRNNLYFGRYPTYNRVSISNDLPLLHHPIVSVDSLYCIVNNTEVDLVASSDYSEGWGESYYIDYRNGIIKFRNFRPRYDTPIRVIYTHGRREHEDGYVIYDGNVETITSLTETSFIVDGVTGIGKYNGKLLKITSGDASGQIYRILSSNSVSGKTTLRTLNGYTMYTDGVRDTDSFEVYAVPHDIQEMAKIYTYLGILIADPTYQHNFTNPFDDPSPQYAQFEWLSMRFHQLLEQRKATIQLLM